MPEAIHPLYWVDLTLLSMMLILAIKHLRSHPMVPWFASFIICIIGVIIHAMMPNQATWFDRLLNDLEYAAPVFFMICLRFYFEDNYRPSHRELGVVGLMLAILVMYTFVAPLGTHQNPTTTAFLLIQSCIGAGCILSAYWTALQGWSADLVTARRRLRLLFAAVIGPVVIMAMVMLLAVYFYRDGLGLANSMIAFIIFIASLFCLITTVEIPKAIFADLAQQGLISKAKTDKTLAPANTNDSQIIDSSAKLLKTIKQSMSEQQLFRQHGLSLASFAKHLSMPEYRLREAINQQLGYRNFNAFLNHYRINAAAEALADKNNTLPILSISIDVGYKSLSPFNKAFRECFDMTPSNYRESFVKPSSNIAKDI